MNNKLLDRDAKDYLDDLDSKKLNNHISQDYYQENQGQQSSNQENPLKIKVRTTARKFKQTEIGLIPEDWEAVKLSKIGVFFKGKGIKKNEVESQGLPCVRYGELYTIYNNVIKNTKSFISKEVARDSFKLNYGDLLLAGSGETKEEIGKSAVILREDTFAGGDIVIFRSKSIEPIFLGYLSNTNQVTKQKTINGQGDAVVHIYSSGISKIKIPLPPLPEQKAIAQVLSDTDAFIQTLEQKLDKKRAIKQGAMQQLLTPNPDSNAGGWELRKLGEIAAIKTGSKNNQDKIIDGLYPFFVRSQTVERINSYSYDCEAILIPGEGGIGSIYHYIDGKFDVHQRVYKISGFSKDTSGKFIYLYMMKNFNVHAMKNSVKATVDSLRLPTFLEFEVFLPPLKEQTHIANILSDMDAEIGQLEQKLNKYKLLKQGLMQELLTGRVRLV